MATILLAHHGHLHPLLYQPLVPLVVDHVVILNVAHVQSLSLLVQLLKLSLVSHWIGNLHLLLLSGIGLHHIVLNSIRCVQILVSNKLLLLLEHKYSGVITVFQVLLGLVNLDIDQPKITLLSCQRILFVIVC